MSVYAVGDVDEVVDNQQSTEETNHPHLRLSEEALKAMEETERPRSSDRLDPSKVTEAPSSAEKVEKVSDPFLAKEALAAMSLFETVHNQRIEAEEAKANRYLDSIDKLMELNSKLISLPDRENQELSKEIQDLFQELKDLGINAWEGGATMTKEQRSKVSDQIKSQIDGNRVKVSATFTRINTLIQMHNSVLESVKNITRNHKEGNATYIRNQRVN